MKAGVDVDTGQILGVPVLGVEGGEIMVVLKIAIMGELPLRHRLYGSKSQEYGVNMGLEHFFRARIGCEFWNCTVLPTGCAGS